MPRLTTAPSPSFWSLAKTFLITDLDTKFCEEEDDIDLMFLNENNPPTKFALFSAALIYYLWSLFFFSFLACVLVDRLMNLGCVLVLWLCMAIYRMTALKCLWALMGFKKRTPPHCLEPYRWLHCVMLTSLWSMLWRLMSLW